MFGRSQPGWSGSVRQILTDESNPHRRRIFPPRANLTLSFFNQTATERSLRPSSLSSPTKHTARPPLHLPSRVAEATRNANGHAEATREETAQTPWRVPVAESSAPAACRGASSAPHRHSGRRVVVSPRLIRAASELFFG